ncbi:hypothetical protein POM88_041662 [Heracleum sosnowskyi]|uniref:Uncharacterized protein n=1 Tax=Heracleum sosnowskyi TaxID=360622 RepID=A0AAD8HGL2_9APIA|nr:hypothetical protein POM88_041662 [Heracleum sosnowskyi]
MGNEEETVVLVCVKEVDADIVVLMAARALRTEKQDAKDTTIVGMLAEPKKSVSAQIQSPAEYVVARLQHELSGKQVGDLQKQLTLDLVSMKLTFEQHEMKHFQMLHQHLLATSEINVKQNVQQTHPIFPSSLE